MRLATFLMIVLAVAPCAPAPAGTADNVRTARRYFLENMAGGRFEHSDAMFAPDFIAHGASINYTLAQDVDATSSWRVAIPDLKVTVERTVADKDMVAVHWRATGLNTVAVGELPGKGDRLGIEGMTMFRFAAGRIAEEWSVVDVATLRKEIDQ
jgi:predicted SnoaL-like aldol condensation-catalyzing enzyme